MTQHIVTHRTLEGFFSELVHEALSAERIALRDDSRAYVVQLVSEFTRRDALHRVEPEGESGTPALFRLYERAMQADPRSRFDAYRYLGDVALVVSGFFAPHVARSNVSVRYYRQMGSGAYQAAAHLDRSGVFAPLLDQLSGAFDRLSEMLCRVAERTTLPTQHDLSALYERWLRAPDSPALRERLLAQSALPIVSGGRGLA